MILKHSTVKDPNAKVRNTGTNQTRSHAQAAPYPRCLCFGCSAPHNSVATEWSL